MYNIRQFKPTLYLLLLLGMASFALAAQSPAVLVLGGGGVLLNGWLMRTGRFQPLPRLWANILTLGSLGVLGRQLFVASTVPVIVIGQFLVALQLVKLWEQRANRDYAQLLVLSLLQMVAAAISTVSLLYGLMLLVYLFLSLYCCLLFHLKVETDAAKAAMPLPEDKIPSTALRQDQRYLARSMRRLTVVVSVVSIAMAVVIFTLFPRTVGQNMITPIQFSQPVRLTGYSDEINLNEFDKLTQNSAVVGRAEVWSLTRKTSGPILLRGSALDSYLMTPTGGRWSKSGRQPRIVGVTRDNTASLFTGARQANAPLRLHMSLNPIGERTLFTLAGPTTITARRDLRVRYESDGALQSDEAINQPMDYEITATGTASDDGPVSRPDGPQPPQVPEAISKAILAEALKPEVTGTDSTGPLGERRYKRAQENQRLTRGQLWLGPDSMDEQIAESIVAYLKGPLFHYTTDLTDANRPETQDPYEWFLSKDGRRGHCQYFAGAMALLCQSLDIQARVVVGYRCDGSDYNDVPGADYYMVKESNAHAWVEVLVAGDDGNAYWETFDPTNSRDVTHASSDSMWGHVKHLVDFLEYSYASKVIAYDNEDRDNIFRAMESKMTEPLYKGINNGMFTPKRGDSLWRRTTKSLPAAAGTAAMVAGALVGGWVLVQHWRLRRRAARIGIDSLPHGERERLARQLGFYDDLIRLLARHKLARPPYMTPREFSRSLLFLPSDAYRTVTRLTALFYKVRFGGIELSQTRHRRLGVTVAELDAMLENAMPARG